jgi:hypothetical protein
MTAARSLLESPVIRRAHRFKVARFYLFFTHFFSCGALNSCSYFARYFLGYLGVKAAGGRTLHSVKVNPVPFSCRAGAPGATRDLGW